MKLDGGEGGVDLLLEAEVAGVGVEIGDEEGLGTLGLFLENNCGELP